MAVFETTGLRLNYLNELRNIALSSFISDKAATLLEELPGLASGTKHAANLALTYSLVKNIFWLNSAIFRDSCADMLQLQFGVPRKEAGHVIEDLARQLAGGESSPEKDQAFLDYGTTLVLLGRWDQSFEADLGFGDTLFQAITSQIDHEATKTVSHEIFSRLNDLIDNARDAIAANATPADLAIRLLSHLLAMHKADVKSSVLPVVMEGLLELALSGRSKFEQLNMTRHPDCSDSIFVRDLLEALSRAELIKSFDQGKTWQPLPLALQLTMPLALESFQCGNLADYQNLPSEWQAAIIRKGLDPKIAADLSAFLIASKPLHKCVAIAAITFASESRGTQYAADAAIDAINKAGSSWAKRTILDAVKDLGNTMKLPISEKILAGMTDFDSHALTASAMSAALRHQLSFTP